MTLSEKDGQLFYKLWLPFLDYVNEKCKVVTIQNHPYSKMKSG